MVLVTNRAVASCPAAAWADFALEGLDRRTTELRRRKHFARKWHTLAYATRLACNSIDPESNRAQVKPVWLWQGPDRGPRILAVSTNSSSHSTRRASFGTSDRR